MKKVKVAALQFDSISDEKNKNLVKALEMLELAGKEKVDIAAIPDYFLTGYPVTKENVSKWAEPIPGPATNELSKVSKKYEIYIVGGGIIEKDGQDFYSTCPILGPNGEMIGKYRKANFWIAPPQDEVGAGLTAGAEYPVFETEHGKIGILLQVDIDFPEPARILGLKGAEIIFWLTAVDYPWMDVCRFLARAYAFNNLAYVITVNRTGVYNNYIFYGESTIINPMGEVLTSAGQSYGTLFPDGTAITTIDINFVQQLRKQLNIFGRRKPETYSLLTSLPSKN